MVIAIFDGTHLHNPWRAVAPPCPNGHPGEVVVFIETGWRCVVCHTFFCTPITLRSKQCR